MLRRMEIKRIFAIYIFECGRIRNKSDFNVGFVSRLYCFYMVAKIFVTAIVMVYNFVTRKIFLER